MKQQTESINKSSTGVSIVKKLPYVINRRYAVKNPKQIKLNLDQVDNLLKRVKNGSLQEGDYEIIKAMAETVQPTTPEQKKLMCFIQN